VRVFSRPPAVFAWAGVSVALDALEVQALRSKAKRSFQALDQGKLLASVLDKDGEAIRWSNLFRRSCA